jgi:hypothetical protein
MAGSKERRVPEELWPSILIACVVQTLNESDNTFQRRFLERLDRAYAEVREDESVSIHSLEELTWTRELLTGFGFAGGQGKPFLS